MWRSLLRISTSALAWMSAAVTALAPRASRRRVTGVRRGRGVGPRPELLGVELDDELLADGHVNLLTKGQLADGHGEATIGGLEPRRGRPTQHVGVPLDDGQLVGLLLERDDVAL